MRQSIQPTYDHRQTGDRFTVETRVQERVVSQTPLTDPFMFHRVTVGWRDLLWGLIRRRLVIEVVVGGDAEIVEDVCELNGDYLGRMDSTRRRDWNESVQRSLRDLAQEPTA